MTVTTPIINGLDGTNFDLTNEMILWTTLMFKLCVCGQWSWQTILMGCCFLGFLLLARHAVRSPLCFSAEHLFSTVHTCQHLWLISVSISLLFLHFWKLASQRIIILDIPKKKIFVNVRKDIVENRNWFCYDLAIQQ